MKKLLEEKLLDQMIKELKRNRMQHIQVLLRFNNYKPCIKFTSIDTENYKYRLKLICSNKKYANQLTLIKETKTTLLYEIDFRPEPHERFWCPWLHRYVYFLNKIDGVYIFYDICDRVSEFTEDDVMKLKKFPDSPVAIIID